MVMALVTILYWISGISINNEGSLVMGYIFKNGLYDILYEVNWTSMLILSKIVHEKQDSTSSAILSEVEESVERRVALHIILIPKPTRLYPYLILTVKEFWKI
jgi:hypothetical protein